MSAVIDLTAFEVDGWTFRLDGPRVKAKPPSNAAPDAIAELRRHRNLVRSLLAIRDGSITLGDLIHDAACIADREGCDGKAAGDGAAQSMGFVNYAEAVRHFHKDSQKRGC